MAVTQIDLGAISANPLDMYPVGAVYLSFDSTSPAQLFGGTWSKISGAFLRADSNTNTGGSDTHTLTVSEMPTHTHSANTGAAASISTNSSKYVQFCYINYSGSQNFWSQNGYTGGGAAHSIMPKYQNVYAWKREA